MTREVTGGPDGERDRCRTALLTLRMIGNGAPAGSAEPYELSGEADPVEVSRRVERATEEVIDALRQAGGDLGTAPSTRFLEYRMRRLRAAADDAVTAARTGSVPVLRRRIAGFDALTGALWQVQSSLKESRTGREE